jgi:hypothetical protein
MSSDGTIRDVRWGGVADKAKLAPGQKLIAVNGRVISGDGVVEAVVAAKTGTDPIHFLMQSETYIKPVDIDYHGGMLYPVMVRDETKKDYLDEITSPLVKVPLAAPAPADTKTK